MALDNTPPEQPEQTGDPNMQPADSTGRLRAAAGRLPWLTFFAVVIVLVGLSLLALSLSGGNNRPLYPNLPTLTPITGTIAAEPLIIGFAELNTDPSAYQGQRLQVSGVYTPVEPSECFDFSGPAIRWSLVAEELQLNAMGFENLLRLILDGTEMTVTGIWRAYHGPVGCGKEPEDGTVWYLDVDRILEPNPLSGASAPAITVIAGSPQPTLSLQETLETPTAVLSPTIEIEEIITPTATLEGTILITATPTLPTTPLVTPLSTPGTPDQLPGTATPEGTTTLSPTPGPSPTPTATGGASGTTTPGLPTTTPSGTGYPSQSTPTATTTGGYP